jgi:hypothetical protein
MLRTSFFIIPLLLIVNIQGMEFAYNEETLKQQIARAFKVPDAQVEIAKIGNYYRPKLNSAEFQEPLQLPSLENFNTGNAKPAYCIMHCFDSYRAKIGTAHFLGILVGKVVREVKGDEEAGPVKENEWKHACIAKRMLQDVESLYFPQEPKKDPRVWCVVKDKDQAQALVNLLRVHVGERLHKLPEGLPACMDRFRDEWSSIRARCFFKEHYEAFCQGNKDQLKIFDRDFTICGYPCRGSYELERPFVSIGNQKTLLDLWENRVQYEAFTLADQLQNIKKLYKELLPGSAPHIIEKAASLTEHLNNKILPLKQAVPAEDTFKKELRDRSKIITAGLGINTLIQWIAFPASSSPRYDAAWKYGSLLLFLVAGGYDYYLRRHIAAELKELKTAIEAKNTLILQAQYALTTFNKKWQPVIEEAAKPENRTLLAIRVPKTPHFEIAEEYSTV